MPRLTNASPADFAPSQHRFPLRQIEADQHFLVDLAERAGPQLQRIRDGFQRGSLIPLHQFRLLRGGNLQGEAGAVTFVADQTAPLEICTNDNPSLLADNDGEMFITITVNERSAQ